MANESTKWLYEQLTNKGYNVGKDIDEFDNLMRTNADSRKWAYETATNEGFNVGKDINEFTSLVAPQPVNPVADVVAKVSELARPSAASGSAGANVSAEASEQTTPAEAAPVDRGQQSWMPSVQDRVRASYQMQTVADELSHRVDEGAAKVARLNEPLTAEGREHRKQKEMEARMAGAPTTLLGLTGPSKAKADEEKSSAPTEKAELRPDAMSPVPYGVEYVDGKAVTKWLMPDGSVTTNMAEADAVEYTARQQRLHDTYLKNTKDISIDIPKEKSIRVGVSESYGKPVIIWRLPDGSLKKGYATPDDEKFIKENQEKFDEFGGNLVSYKFNQEAAVTVQPKTKQAAEQAWKAAEAAFGEKIERNRRNADILLSSAANSSDAAAFKQLETIDNFTDRLTTHDLDALMDAAWSNLGEAGQKSLIDDCYKILQRQNPESDKIALYNLAKDYARQQSDKSLYNLAVEKNMPKNGLDYFMRKISDVNLVTILGKGIAVNRVGKTGDMAAYEAANEQYRQDGHKILDVAGMVTGFAFDPTAWLSAGVGGAATRGTMWAGGRFLAGRGASAAVKQAATRQFANTMTGRLVGGVVGGPVNFGTFEGIKELENQFAHGGQIVGQDETGRYINEGYSASAVGGQVLHGLGMGAAIGWLGPVTGNVSDKLVRATSSTLGKVATRAGIYTGATIAEGTIFSIPEWIEGGRDGFDVWTDNMAMMVGFKAKHIVKSAGGILRDLKASFDSPTNGSKNRLDFESCLRQRMDAPSDSGLALTKDEQAELQRYGYNLRDLVESAERTGNAKEGGLIAQNAPEIVSRLTDMVTDPRVSEAARAKMYYYATGRKLPMSTVMRGELFEDGNGGFVVESQGANGVITSRSFTNRKAADLELERIRRQSELNQLELGERYQPIADFESRMMEASRRVAANHGWNPVDVYKTCEDVLDSYVRGNNKELSDVQKNIYSKILAELDKIEVSDLATEKRTRINAKYDVDIDKAIRKEPNRRTEAEQKAIDEYIAELMPRRNRGNGMFDEAGRRLLPEEGAPRDVEAVNYREVDENGQTIDPRFEDDFVGDDPHNPAEQPLGRAVMKYQDREVEVLSGRVVMTDDGTMVDKRRSDRSIVIRDVATGKVEMVAPEAILSYEGYADEGELLDAPISPESPYVGESVGAESTGAISAAPVYDLYDTFSVNIEGRDRPLQAAVVERDGNTITIWTPEAVNQASAKSRTMRGYLTDFERAELDEMLTRDEQGAPVGYVSADREQDSKGVETDINSINEYGYNSQNSVNLQYGNRPEQDNAINTRNDGGRVVDDATRSVEANRDRSDIRMYEEEVGPQQSSHSDYSERDRREAESQRLVGLARQNGQYKERNEVRSFGKRISKPSGESEVVINKENGRVYKIKDPFAKSPMKGNVQPEDAIYEHLVHNKYFPETRYQFEGVSDEAGDLRIVLSQGYVESVGQPTKEQIETALAEKGLHPEGKYSYGNEEITVTDVTGDNALLGADGNVYFIDPIIDFKKPVREILGDNTTVRSTPTDALSPEEQVIRSGISGTADGLREGFKTERERIGNEWLDDPDMQSAMKAYTEGAGSIEEVIERAKADSQNDRTKQRLDSLLEFDSTRQKLQALLDRSTVSNGEPVKVSEAPQTALSRVPLNDKGNPDFRKAEPEVAWDALVEKTDNEGTAQGFADNMVKRSEEALKKAEKIKLPSTDDIDEFIAADKNRQSEIDAAKATLEHWKQIAGINASRQKARQEAEAERLKAEREAQAELERQENEAENAWREQRRKLDNKVRETADVMREVPEAVEILGNTAPQDIYEAAALVLSTNKILAKDSGVRRGYRSLTGGGAGEQRKLFGLFARAENGGKSMESLAEDEMQQICETYGIPYDNADAMNALIEVVRQSNTVGDIRNYITNNRIRQANEYYDQWVEQMKANEEQMYLERYHMSKEDYEAYVESLEAEYAWIDEETLRAVDNMFAEYSVNEINDRNYERENERTAAVGSRGAEVLSGSPSDFIRRSEAIEAGKSGTVRGEGGREHDVAPESTSAQRGIADRGTPDTDIAVLGGAEPSESGTETAGNSRGGNLSNGRKSEVATQQERLSKEEATDIIAKMEMSAVTDPKISLSPESWQNTFGLSNSIGTPLGKVKMGEGQYQKLVDKKRSAEFGMVVQTLQDPDVVFIEPSEAKEGQTTERGFSYVFVKTFIRDGKKFKYYTSVSVLKDGMEVSVSSHIASKTAILKKLQGMERAYTKETLLPNSSEWHLAEHPSDVPDLLPTQGKSEISDGKVTNSASEKQESGAESSVRSSVQPSDNKGEQAFQSAVETASAEVNTAPTPAQVEAGNYKKGHVTIGELDITIENPAGSTRKGVDANGKEWSTTMANAYGYIKGTEGVDGDHIDVFLHQDMDSWNGRKVYVVDQTNTDGTFDEHKVMLGFNDKGEAMSAYFANYDSSWAQTHPSIRISETNIEDFNKWVQSSHRKTKPFADYKNINKEVSASSQGSVAEYTTASKVVDAARQELRLRDAAVKESTDDSAEITRLSKKYRSAPIKVVKSIEDIKSDDLSEDTLEEIAGAMEEAETQAIYCKENKKIYIFAGKYQDGELDYIVAHESVHAAVDKLGLRNGEELNYYRKSIAGIFDNEAPAELNKIISEKYAPEDEDEEFLAYTLPWISRNKKRMRRVLETGDGRLVDFINQLNEEIYGKEEIQSMLSATEERTSTNVHGGRGGQDRGRRGTSETVTGDDSGGDADNGNRQIEDFGEKIAGARKDALSAFAKTIENVSVQSLIELPMSKAFTRPNLRKMVETGAISDEDAILAEAILQGQIYAHRKPALTKRQSSKKAVEEWARATYGGISMLGEILSGDPSRREAAILQYNERLAAELEAANAHVAKMREWNPGKKIEDVKAIPNPIDITRRVLEGIGYHVGDAVKLPLTNIELSSNKQYYIVGSAGKQGALWFKMHHDTLDGAVDTMIMAAKLARGDRDVELPLRQFVTKGVGTPHKELTGKYEVLYFAKDGKTVKSRVFDGKDKAEVFAADNKGSIRELVKYTNDFDAYAIEAINPLTGERHTLRDDFGSRAEASTWIDESYEEANNLALDALYKEMNVESTPRSHYYVESVFRHGKMVGRVVEDDKKNPWRFTKYFESRKEADEWLAANVERLEAERKAHLDQKRKIVYFENTNGERRGVDYRGGEDATPEMFSETFGFRGVQFGNWTNNADRQAALNQAYDALMDLSNELGITPRAVSLDGELGLAFGARGTGGATAHYEPVEVVINLTKTKGAGALAHEWWHAVDNFLSRKAGVAMGYATARNGLEGMRPEIREAVTELMDALDNSAYARRSRDKGDYWGRPTELGARLFAAWLAERMKERGVESPFLTTGLSEAACDMYQRFNYIMYEMRERDKAEIENRELGIMSREEFNKLPESLHGYPYPTALEIEDFGGHLSTLFGAMSEREKQSGSIANERGGRYKKLRSTTAGMSLFDWADAEEIRHRQSKSADEKALTAEVANNALDEYAEAYNNYLDRWEDLERHKAEVDKDSMEAQGLQEAIEQEERMAVEARERLIEALSDYYLRDNTPEDTRRIARDMAARVQAEVEIRRDRSHVLSDILPGGDVVDPIGRKPEQAEAKQVKTAGGNINYNALGHLPDAKAGEFAYVERQFSRTGDFLFTGNGVIKDRGDVAYLFKALEDYSIEHVFAAFVKDGKVKVLHIGMGGPTSSFADLGAIRAGYDAFGADAVYLVHNHPSGNLSASVPDMRLMKTLEAAFGDEVAVGGIIIDTTSGRYTTFGGTGETGRYDMKQNGGEDAVDVMRFDGVDRSAGRSESVIIANSADIARYVSERRLGAGDKISYLVLSNRNEIVGNFHTDYDKLDASGLAEEIASVTTKYGGVRAVVYGNVKINKARELSAEVSRLSLGAIKMLDAIEVTNGINRSANDEGLLYEPGSEFSDTQNGEKRYRELENDARLQEMAQTSAEAKRHHAERMSKKFNTTVRIVADVKDVPAQLRNKKGAYDVKSGEIVVVIPNHVNVEDVAETVFHEVVAHKGLREMIGEENYDAFCDEVYNHLKDDLKKQVDEETTRRFMNEPGKGYEHHRRVSVDELFGRMAEKGFEDFTKAERGVWTKLKAKVLEAINKFLGSLKLPKWVKLGDNELRYMLWRSHGRLRTKGDYVDMARDAAKREELGLRRNEVVRERTSTDDYQAKKKVANINEARLDDLHPANGDHAAKVAQKLETAKSALMQIARSYKTVRDPRGFITSLKNGLSMIGGVSSSGYRSFELKDGRILTLRVSNHNINSENAQDEPVVSIVIKSRASRNSFVPAIGKTVDEYVYMKEEIRKADADTLSEIAIGLAELLDTGIYIDRTGLARENHSPEGKDIEYRFRDGETGDIWKDHSVGLEERITNAAIRLSNNQSGDLSLRNDAQKAVIDNLQSLLHEMRNRQGIARSFAGADRKVEARVVDAMNAQGMFDRTTVKRVSDLARILLQNGYLSEMTSGEIQRLLSAVKNATAMHDISDSVQKIMDIMVNNQLRNGEASLRQLLAIRGSKVDARGVEVQGVLDVEGQRTMEVVKDAISLTEDDITDRIAEALNRMSDPDQTIADQAALEYAGLNMALDYVQNIANSKTEEKTLRDELKRAKEDRDAGRMTDDAYKQFVETTEDAIRKNKIERAEAYFNLVGRLSDSLRGSIENAKAFREAEKARVNEIHHNANSDMEGRPANEHHKDDWKDKFANNGFVQFFFAPLGTFDQILRVFGNKSANGEGYLWNRFMRGWVDCRNKELLGVKEKYARLDEKAAELFGKGKTWGNLIRMEAKMPKATVSFWDGGEMRDHELTQGNLLYVYMVDKMTDGRMKLRRMGITESDIAKIENFLDPRFKALSDWLQEEFLVDTRNEYNETHKRMFGASMAAIDNYFPLKILKNARIDKEEDVNQQNRPDGITTKTGSIIKRRVNNLALDVTGANALSIVLDHIIQMEHWNAYAEWNRDLNTLRTYKRFRNQVVNMTTVYGGGEELWENFNDLCTVAAGEYQPPVAKLDKAAVNFAKGVSAAKVNFRIFTALKQLLSAPAYAPEVSIRAIAKSIANPYGDFKWCMENMPIFRERWHSRISGDPRLLKSDMDWKMWRSRVMEISSRIGMSPNAFVDAVTVSIGARAMYETRLKQYVKEGYPADIAKKRALQDATILFNQTQQSSESPFLSTIQLDRSWMSVLYTVFRNSSMSYTRQEFDAMRNLKRNLTPGQRTKSIEFMTKQILRDWGVDPDKATDAEQGKAEDAAKSRFRRQIKKDVVRVATFGYILQALWNLGSYLPYIIFGNNDDEKDKMLDDVFTHSFFGSIEGLTGGDVMSAFGNMALSGEWSRYQLTKDMPLASDMNTIIDKFISGKNAEGFNDIISLVVQMGVGMNPQSITDAVIAITDACGDDLALSHEAAIFIMRVLQVPQSQLDKLYFDDVDLTGKEASKLIPEQLAARYAEYKVKRGTPLMPWAWGDEEQLDKYKKKATKIMKERLDSQGDTDVNETYVDLEARYQTVSEEVKKAEALMETDYVAAAQAYAALQQDPDFTLYQSFGSLDTELGRISKMWLTSKTPEEAALIASTIPAYRAGMVKVLQAETEENQQSALSELSTLMTEFYTKYQAMQPRPQ